MSMEAASAVSSSRFICMRLAISIFGECCTISRESSSESRGEAPPLGRDWDVVNGEATCGQLARRKHGLLAASCGNPRGAASRALRPSRAADAMELVLVVWWDGGMAGCDARWALSPRLNRG